MEKGKLSIVTEVGAFGSLNIDDPTVSEIKPKKKVEETDIDKMVQEAITENASISI